MFLYEGPFGEAVAHRLVASPGSWTAVPLKEREVSGRRSKAEYSFVAVAAGFLGSAAMQELGNQIDLDDKWWLPVRLQDRFLFAGPVIGPETPCLACFDKRTLAKPPYSRTSEVERLVRRYRNGTATAKLAESGGFTPSVASMAAAIVADVSADPAKYGRRFWQVDCLYASIETGVNISVPGCRRCEARSEHREEAGRHALASRYTGTVSAVFNSLFSG